MMITKRNIQYCTEGVWIDNTSPLVTISPAVARLHTNWKTSTSPTFQIFRKYFQDIRDLCVSDKIEKRDNFFILKSSNNKCKDRIRTEAASRSKVLLNHTLRDDLPSLSQIEDILCPRMSASLLDMSRLQPSGRRHNEDFKVMLKRKLRLPLWPKEMCKCKCGAKIDAFGDHVMSCRHHCKTPMSNSVRDGVHKLLQETCKLVKMTSSNAMVDKEPEGMVKPLPYLRPFDISVLLDHMLDETAWRSPLKRIGFDVTMITSNTKCKLTSSRIARKNELQLRLRTGEKGKCCRTGKSDKHFQTTLTGEDIIKNILNDNMALCPISVSPHGHTGSLFERFLHGTEPFPSDDYPESRPHAKRADQLVRSIKMPHGILTRPNTIWNQQHPNTFYGDSYHTMNPASHFEQNLGLVISTAISSHLLRAHNKLRY